MAFVENRKIRFSPRCHCEFKLWMISTFLDKLMDYVSSGAEKDLQMDRLTRQSVARNNGIVLKEIV